jgi:aryl-alcohol dehydrogenase-like predicted oxidoreductase
MQQLCTLSSSSALHLDQTRPTHAPAIAPQEGKIREWGLSNETAFGVCKMCEVAKRLGVKPPVAIQNDVSLVLRSFEGDLAEACAPSNNNVG